MEDPAPAGVAPEDFAFFEAYFSYYIEGTTFEIEEAKSIIFEGRIIENRSEDSHDILGIFHAPRAQLRESLPNQCRLTAARAAHPGVSP